MNLPVMSAANVDEYMEQYGVALGTEARRAMRPLHDPAVDMPSEVPLRRPAFPAQAHAVMATAKCLERLGACICSGEMGTGKTLWAIMAAIEHHARTRGVGGFRVIVMCPGHLVDKWAREIQETAPEYTIVVIEKWDTIFSLHHRMKRDRPKRPTFFLVSRETAKLGPGWHPVYYYNEREGKPRCRSCHELIVDSKGEPLPLRKFESKQLFCESCGEHLWTYDAERVRKWMPADYMKKKMKGYFDYLVLDEAHEEKSTGSEQAIAAGKLMSIVDYSIVLTGTILGGYAEDIRALLFRLFGKKMRERGYTWEGATQFARDYGRLDTIITKTEDCNSTATGKGSQVKKDERIRPGIMPTLFGDMLMDCTVFLSLNEISDNLPSFTEEIIPVDMSEDQGKAYKHVADTLSSVARTMLASKDRRLLATVLQTTLSYADHPFGWDEVGYLDKPKIDLIDEEALRENQKLGRNSKHRKVVRNLRGTFVPVVSPPNLDESDLYPKEKALLDIVTNESRQGRQVWVFVQNTNARDMLARLESVLSRHHFRVRVLRSNTVKPSQREKWIYENGRGVDVIVSHPRLVQTGMDLFDKGGNHNFPTIVFYQTGYETVVLRQASRRSWRIGQRRPCRVYYLYYKGTMQSQAMELMGNKIKASTQVEGKFSAEGLAQMCDDTGGIEMALAKKLANMEEADDQGTIRAWEKISGTSNSDSFCEREIEYEQPDGDDLPDDIDPEQAMQELDQLLSSLISE